MSRESMDFDVVIVGAGPAGLSASIRLAQLAKAEQRELNICVIDKGAEVGAHILSGAVLEPRALDELLPNWRDLNFPLHTPCTHDEFLFMSENHAFKLPTPLPMHNKGNVIVSLGLTCRFLAEQAENLGVNIFPGFAGVDIEYEGDRAVGVITGDLGLNRFGEPKAQFQEGMLLRAKQTIIAEGCRGSLAQKLFDRFDLREGVDPQTYGLGIKELWEIDTSRHEAGKVVHTIGWPLDHRTYGGSFIYHFGENYLAIGFVVGLDYQNPYLNPYEEFQRFKMHPKIKPLLLKGKRIAYGARTLIEGGLQSLPKLTFPGGLIIGDAAGFLNVPKIKGIHNAMKSAMVAAESVYPLIKESYEAECKTYSPNLKQSWLWQDLYRVRNIRPSLRFGLLPGLCYAALDTYVFRGHAPWTFHHHQRDRDATKKAKLCKPIVYPKHDQVVSFDLPSSVYLANISYVEDQPYHLKLKSRQEVPIEINYKEFASPETRYCPAGVYEVVKNDKEELRLQINGGNCIHCKACDIKDPSKNIIWTPSEGGSGPQYEMM